MAYFAQVDDTLVTGLLESPSMPTTLPPGRTFVDITALPDKNVLGYTYDSGTDTFTPPNEPAVLPADIVRVVSKLGA